MILINIILFAIFSLNCKAVDITDGPPSYDKPWVPAWGFNKSDHTIWKKHHEHMLKQTEENKDKIKVVFLGDSKTYYWLEPGKQFWDEYYVKRGAFNYGIRGDSTRQILWRLQHKELDGLSPKLVVFMIGGNNFKNNYNKGTDEVIVKAMEIIIEKLKEKLADTPIIFVGQLPRTGASNKRGIDINNLLEKHYKTAPSSLVHFVNFYDKYTNSDGSQNKQLYVSDEIHLSGEGYKILAESLEPTIKKLLDEN